MSAKLILLPDVLVNLHNPIFLAAAAAGNVTMDRKMDGRMNTLNGQIDGWMEDRSRDVYFGRRMDIKMY